MMALALVCTSPVSTQRDSDCEVLESHTAAIQWYVGLLAGKNAVQFTGLQGQFTGSALTQVRWQHVSRQTIALGPGAAAPSDFA
jgi:hypothetical protein